MFTVQASATTFLARTSWSRRWRWTGWVGRGTTREDGTSWSNSARSVSTKSLTLQLNGEGQFTENLKLVFFSTSRKKFPQSSIPFNWPSTHIFTIPNLKVLVQELHPGPDERLPDCPREKDEAVCWIPVQSCRGRTHRHGQLVLSCFHFCKLLMTNVMRRVWCCRSFDGELPPERL